MQHETGIVYSLKQLGERFVAFAKTSSSSVQAWEQVDDRIDTFYGATLKIPLHNSDDVFATENYYFIGDESLIRYAGTSDIDIPTYLQAKYPNDNITIDTSRVTLESVYNYVNGLSLHRHGVLIFNGVENAIVNGQSIQQIITNVEIISNRCLELGLIPILYLTPNSNVYSSSSYIALYEAFINNGYIGDKKSIVCVGDGLTAGLPDSWVSTAQNEMTSYHFINRADVGYTMSNVVNNFQQDVIDLSPDVCFFLIGLHDLATNAMASVDSNIASLDAMVTSCIDHNILPVIGLYRPTLRYIRGANPSQPELDVLEAFNSYLEKCIELAERKGIKTIDVFYALRGGYGNIDSAYLSNDTIHFSTLGASVIGRFMVKELKNVFLYGMLGRKRSASVFNTYDIFCKALNKNKLSVSDISSFLSLNGKSYNTQGLSYIVEEVKKSNFSIHSSGVNFYVSFQYNKINKDSTYDNWFHSKDGYLVEKFNQEDAEVRKEGSVSYVSKYGGLNPFKNSGQILAIGLHTLFDKNLWMCEQGGITCAEEALNQKETDGLLPVRRIVVPPEGEPYESLIQPPPFPGRGCPWFAFSDDDEENYKIKALGIKYWFTKNNYDATIVYCTSEQIGEPVFQSLSFGKLNAVNEMSYKFPLYIAGGTTALVQDVYVYTPVTGDLPRPAYGNSYDLSLKNVSLSSCGILRPCKFNGATGSNFRVLSPEGIWRNIFGCSQASAGHQYYSCGVIYDWMTVLQPPNYDIGLTEHSAIPMMNDGRDAVDFRVPISFEKANSGSFLGRVTVVFNMDIDHNEDGIQGYVPNVYCICRRDTPVGEIRIDGRLFLSVPNNYESKKEYYPVNVGLAINSGWTPEEILAREEEDPIKTRIYDRILIPLEGEVI